VAEREIGPELVERLTFEDDERPAPRRRPVGRLAKGDRSEFERFVAANVQAQRQGASRRSR